MGFLGLYFHLFRKGGAKIAAPKASLKCRPVSRWELQGLRTWVVGGAVQMNDQGQHPNTLIRQYLPLRRGPAAASGAGAGYAGGFAAA